MALTNAERQAAFKARKAETMDALAQQNAALARSGELRAEVDKLKEKAHRLELAALRAQLKARGAGKAVAAKKAPSRAQIKALTAFGLRGHGFLKREAHTVPAAQVLSQTGEMLAVLLAHPTESGFTVL